MSVETRAELRDECLRLIDALADGARDDAARDALLAKLLAFQRVVVPPYARLCAQSDAFEPALPTDVFRFARVAAHAELDDVQVFRTSGSTDSARGAHCLRDLSLYARAAHAAARYALFPDVSQMRLLIVAPSHAEQPDSSLAWMLERFVDWFGTTDSAVYVRGGELELDALCAALAECEQKGEPVALLGTSFAFVHVHDGLGGRSFRLPAGSRVMQTGGFKGRSRQVEPAAMLQMLAADFGVEPRCIVQEYGMTELSSQLYETTLREVLLGLPETPRRLWVPGWVRVTPVDPQTLEPVADGAQGLLRIDDAANLDSVASIQTSDVGERVGDGVRVFGRAPGALARGCSLAMDAALSGTERRGGGA